MALKYSEIYSDDFGGGLNWSPDRAPGPVRRPYKITDAAEDGLRREPNPKIAPQEAEAFGGIPWPSWIPSESAVIALGAGLTGVALFFQLHNGSWKPELFWLSFILALVAVAKSRAK